MTTVSQHKTTIRQVVASMINDMNAEVDWNALEEKLPQIQGNSLLLTVTGETGGNWGLLVDQRRNRLSMVRPEMVRPTATCTVDHRVAWEMLECKTAGEILGVYGARRGSGLVAIEVRDRSKRQYHEQLLAFVWELLRTVMTQDEAK